MGLGMSMLAAVLQASSVSRWSLLSCYLEKQCFLSRSSFSEGIYTDPKCSKYGSKQVSSLLLSHFCFYKIIES